MNRQLAPPLSAYRLAENARHVTDDMASAYSSGSYDGNRASTAAAESHQRYSGRVQPDTLQNVLTQLLSDEETSRLMQVSVSVQRNASFNSLRIAA